MNEKILFMIIGNSVQFLQNNTMDHREWYNSLGFDPNLFESIVRGYVIENKIVFFKGMTFTYDEEVIKMARTFSPTIREYCHNQSLEVYCGIIVPSGGKWEPVLHIKNEEITGIVPTQVKEEKVKKEPIETGPVLEFKNNINDSNFQKKAIIITSIVMLLAIIIKIFLFSKKEILQLQNSMDVILVFSQIILLGITIYGYIKKMPSTKYLGLVSSILLILTLDIFDIILGILYFLFSIDQGYFTSFINSIKKISKKKNS